jgi:hypothetical protein
MELEPHFCGRITLVIFTDEAKAMKHLIIAVGLTAGSTVVSAVPSLSQVLNLTGQPGMSGTKSTSPNDGATFHSQGYSAPTRTARRRATTHNRNMYMSERRATQKNIFNGGY